MANFKYKARDKFAKLVSGTAIALNKEQAVKNLHELGYAVVQISEPFEFSPTELLKQFKRIKLEDLSTFTRQLYSLQKAGLPLLSSLETLAQQIENRYFRGVIGEIALDLRAGSSFSASLKKHGNIFDSIYVNMINAAESAGLLTDILSRLTDLLEQDIDTRNRIQTATRYPLLAFFVLCAAFLIVVTFVIPRFAVIYGQFNAALPLPTQILIVASAALRKFWYLCLLGLGLAIFGFRQAVNSKAGRPAWDNFKLKVPVFGKLVTLLAMSRFARVTAVLMKSGVPILEILDLVTDTTSNVIIQRAIKSIKESVIQGKGMSEPMKVANLFPPIVVSMVATGEQTGKVDDLLLSVADYYDLESGYMIKNLTTYIEPILIFVLAVMVLVMALAIFMPMWNLIKVFRPG